MPDGCTCSAPVPTDDPRPAAVPAVDRDAVLAAGAEARDARVRASYDAVAPAYADHLVDELLGSCRSRRWLLDRVAAHADGGPVVEVGCGPGHVTAYLAEAGADAIGLDLSPAMVAEARSRFPDGSYEVGDLRRLMRPTYGAGWAAVLAWYSLIHLAASELPDALAALTRPLLPGRLAGRRPARRLRGPPQRRLVRRRRSTSTSCSTTPPRSSPRSRLPASPTSSGTTAARSPAATRPPSGSTSSAASRTDHAGAVLARPPASATSSRCCRSPRAFRDAGHDVLWATAAQATPLVTRPASRRSPRARAEPRSWRCATPSGPGGGHGRRASARRTCSHGCSARR